MNENIGIMFIHLLLHGTGIDLRLYVCQDKGSETIIPIPFLFFYFTTKFTLVALAGHELGTLLK